MLENEFEKISHILSLTAEDFGELGIKLGSKKRMSTLIENLKSGDIKVVYHEHNDQFDDVKKIKAESLYDIYSSQKPKP